MKITILALLVIAGCSHVAPPGTAPLQLREDTLTIHAANKEEISLPARWVDADRRSSTQTTVIMIPGSGNLTAAAVQNGDGFKNYAKPFASGTIWQEKLARAGYDVLAYDKRPGTSGPSALAVDVDTACKAVEKRFGSSRKTILWSSEQGTQVILSSKCLNKAYGLVLISPIPDALDRVWISGLKEAGLRNRAESLSATFDSIRKGLFEPNAKVMGASLAFWKEWLVLAERTPKQLEALNLPLLFVVGEDDVLLGRYGRKILERIVSKNKNRKLIVIPRADRNLLQKEALSPSTVEIILGALGVLENKNG